MYIYTDIHVRQGCRKAAACHWPGAPDPAPAPAVSLSGAP